jgi:prefoldin subunit 5
VQVDQLKKELAQQVVMVAQDLGRLESEKREVETKIANLHAFHANQKQRSGEVGSS